MKAKTDKIEDKPREKLDVLKLIEIAVSKNPP
jgi:hypothetical protein